MKKTNNVSSSGCQNKQADLIVKEKKIEREMKPFSDKSKKSYNYRKNRKIKNRYKSLPTKINTTQRTTFSTKSSLKSDKKKRKMSCLEEQKADDQNGGTGGSQEENNSEGTGSYDYGSQELEIFYYFTGNPEGSSGGHSSYSIDIERKTRGSLSSRGDLRIGNYTSESSSSQGGYSGPQNPQRNQSSKKHPKTPSQGEKAEAESLTGKELYRKHNLIFFSDLKKYQGSLHLNNYLMNQKRNNYQQRKQKLMLKSSAVERRLPLQEPRNPEDRCSSLDKSPQRENLVHKNNCTSWKSQSLKEIKRGKNIRVWNNPSWSIKRTANDTV